MINPDYIPRQQPDSPMQPGPRPGMVYLRQLDMWVEMENHTQEPIYDSELVISPVAAGDTFIFFRDPAFPTGVRKDRRHTNMISQRQLPSGWSAIIYQMSVRVLFLETSAASGLFTTPEDALRLYYEGVARFTTGDQKIEKEAPLVFWPSPHGLTGNITRTGGAFTTFGTVNNGIPSLSATIALDLPIYLTNELTFEGVVTFPGGTTLDNNTMVQFVLHTYMSKPVR